LIKCRNQYQLLDVVSFCPASAAGRHGNVHVRPLRGQWASEDLFVECSKEMVNIKRYPVGTRFRICAKVTDRLGSGPYVYTYFGWPFEVLGQE
jgi:hypothetical protein